jgi:phosphoglycolate phosphatase
MSACVDGAAVIFDLDGTLVDSAPDIAASVTHALQHIGIQSPPLARIKSYIGNGANRLIHRSLTGDVDGIAEDILFESASYYFFDHYEKNICSRSTPYPGVVETLGALLDRGYVLACVTNKPARFTDPLLEQLELDRFFSVTISGDSLDRKKPFPDQLLYVARHCEISPQKCVMVGDTATDVIAAKDANMSVVFVSYGYGDLSDIVSHNPMAIIDSFDEIVGVLTVEPSAG